MAFQKLQDVLAQKDFELAKLQQELSDLKIQESEVKKEENKSGLNLDYLKNVIIQVAEIRKHTLKFCLRLRFLIVSRNLILIIFCVVYDISSSVI